jgi:hypothetical protein
MNSLQPELRMSSVLFCDVVIKHFQHLMRPYLKDLVPNYAHMLGSWSESGVSHHLTSFIRQTGDKAAAHTISKAQKKDTKKAPHKSQESSENKALTITLTATPTNPHPNQPSPSPSPYP